MEVSQKLSFLADVSLNKVLKVTGCVYAQKYIQCEAYVLQLSTFLNTGSGPGLLIFPLDMHVCTSQTRKQSLT